MSLCFFFFTYLKMCTEVIKNRKPYLLKMNSSHYVTLSKSLKGLKLFQTFIIEVIPGWKCFSYVALISDTVARESNETFKSVTSNVQL